MAAGVIHRSTLSPEAREWLANQLARAERHIVAHATVAAAERNDDVVLPSHLERAWGEVLGKRLNLRRLIAAAIAGAVAGGASQALFGGVGKAIGGYLLSFLR